METITKNIVHILNVRGIKHKYLAMEMGISDKKLSAILNNRQGISHEQIVDVCRILNITPNDLYGVQPGRKTA